MAGKFLVNKFSELNINDPFFDSLKSDYPEDGNNIGFTKWFAKKSQTGAKALVFSDKEGLGAFVCLKKENEPIELVEGTLTALPRIKISTLLLAERFRGQRLGEGAIGLILWEWQRSNTLEIYVTVFEKHILLIEQLKRFGFLLVGHNLNGECVYLKDRRHISYSDPYKSFPFINPQFEKAGYLIVDDHYHDTLFPYSELKNTMQEQIALSVANGISKVYVGAQYKMPHYNKGEPLLIYRRHTQPIGQKRYKSCITSFCVVTDVVMVKNNYRYYISYDELLNRISNKSVFDSGEIKEKFDHDKNLVVVEMLYYGFFGKGHNVNNAWLSEHGYMPRGVYPTDIQLSSDDFKRILQEGDINVSNVIID